MTSALASQPQPTARRQSFVLSMVTLFITVAVPVVLVLLSVRLVMSPLFLSYEYNRPGFPLDAYGITREERLTYGPLAIDYLLSDAGIEVLSSQRFEDGTPFYTPLELQHMEDVKVVTRTAFNLLVILLVLLAGIAVLALRSPADSAVRKSFWQGILNGGLLTLGLIVTVVLGAVFAWDYFFVTFHRLFFADGTWIFLYSDTLIRLFPERLWFDAALLIGLLTVCGAVIFTIFSWVMISRSFRNH
jgi:integral membrane protein (TIGR01906 family)